MEILILTTTLLLSAKDIETIMIKTNSDKSHSIGRKLILSFSIILFLTILSVIVAIYSINRIDKSEDTLTRDSIPALVSANKLSSTTLDVIYSSNEMNTDLSAEQLISIKESTLRKANQALIVLDQIRNIPLIQNQVDEVKNLLAKIQNNVIKRSEIIHSLIELNNQNSHELGVMNSAIEKITDITSLMEVDADAIFSEHITQLQNDNKDSILSNITKLIEKDFYTIEAITSLNSQLAHIQKDIKSISQTEEKEHVLSIQQEFDHELRGAVRTILRMPTNENRSNIGENINPLIEYGQDTPDVFENRIKIIQLGNTLKNIEKNNLELTTYLNKYVSEISTSIKESARNDSLILEKTISASSWILIIIAIAAIFTSIAIVWLYIYKTIITKLMYLSSVAKQLSKGQHDTSIDITGSDELADIAKALGSIKKYSLKQKEDTLLIAEKSKLLERSNEDLSQFAYVASHDLKEPLRMISSYVQLLSQKYSGKLEGDADQYINYAVDGCLRMKTLIDGLLMFSRVESSNEEMININIHDIIKDVIFELELQIKESNAKVMWQKIPNIHASSSQVRTVFRNLISNSIKYCEQEIPKINISAIQHDDLVEISLQDNGIGIEDQYQDKIFTIFSRLHSREKYSGTGIGLSITKKIIDRHGGAIWLASEPEKGTTFHFTFPIAA